MTAGPVERVLPRTLGRRAGLRGGPVGVRWRGRAVVIAAVVVAGSAALLLVSLVDGTLTIPLGRVWAALTGEGSTVEQLVVVDRRLSRAGGALLVGFALGAAGALTQSITRNPIATPDILGVTTGASAVAVLVATNPQAVLGNGQVSAVSVLTPAALVGGLAATALVLALAWRGGFDGLRLVLVGLGVNALGIAAISWMLTRTTTSEAAIAVRWLTGSLDGIRTEEVRLLLPVTAAGAVACVVLCGSLASLRLGRDVAASLGTRRGRVEGISLAVAVALVSVTTAVAGPIGFVAFVAPQAALRLFRTPGPPPLAGGLFGAALMLVADMVSQRLPTPVPVGITTSVIGAPFLLVVLVRHLRRSSV